MSAGPTNDGKEHKEPRTPGRSRRRSACTGPHLKTLEFESQFSSSRLRIISPSPLLVFALSRARVISCSRVLVISSSRLLLSLHCEHMTFRSSRREPRKCRQIRRYFFGYLRVPTKVECSQKNSVRVLYLRSLGSISAQSR